MMLRDVISELIRRRLWPIPAVALLVALAAPALFLKPATDGTPATAPASAGTGKLPARAQRVLVAGDASASRGGATGSPRDPFEPPASQRARSAKRTSDSTSRRASSSSDPSGNASQTEPIPVIIQNADGSSPSSGGSTSGAPSSGGSTSGAPSSGGSTSGAPSSGGSTSGGSTSGAPSSPRGGDGGSSSGSAPVSTPSEGTPSVDVRFGESADSRTQPSIAPLQPFFIHGKLAAVFVKYSPSRDRAVFAVAPGIVVSGPVECRLKEGVCYLDIPGGSYARLAMLTPDGTIVRRRLDVLRIDSAPAGADTTATAAKDRGENACLLRKLQTQESVDVPVDRDACER